ncbi:HEPN domain-containing protein [Pseudobutyrivibrio xylanivorans]|uniref:Uncharacterized protein, contains HEPN domain, UPF0332 family n=1 Tax=Pseudobutyrivibrio xylanivorans DSM 14809 TaxID=1123012 RepID=A0A1M6JWM7_PSEXY|nr:HEPN domain-containing protein [Pseudobutyrivibrio xylanivorans]SHJ51064.1 Uncharacterized protein, contains HEPN domain, UPF0332 family [Pseudobutyrivibrio xylanivorans DSM 14809]
MEGSLMELSKYRFETAQEDLYDAKLMLENGRYKNALNRGYYSIFHAIRSVNALDGFDSSKHSGVIAHFNQEYVKNEVFPKELSKLIKEASENREKADYLDFFIASKDEAERQISRAEKVIDYIERYLREAGVL